MLGFFTTLTTLTVALVWLSATRPALFDGPEEESAVVADAERVG